MLVRLLKGKNGFQAIRFSFVLLVTAVFSFMLGALFSALQAPATVEPVVGRNVPSTLPFFLRDSISVLRCVQDACEPCPWPYSRLAALQELAAVYQQPELAGSRAGKRHRNPPFYPMHWTGSTGRRLSASSCAPPPTSPAAARSHSVRRGSMTGKPYQHSQQ